MALSHGFVDRWDAGRQLADAVAARLGPLAAPPLVLALPRGGLPVAAEVARRLGGELDVVVARKIGVPYEPEVALGAVCAEGPPYFNSSLIQRLGLDEATLQEQVAAARAEAHRRVELYRSGRAAPRITDRQVIVVDDGLATGATAHAALIAVREHHPRQLLLAAPVASTDAIRSLESVADDVVCVLGLVDLIAIGPWYQDFHQLTDDEVIGILTRIEDRSEGPPGG